MYSRKLKGYKKREEESEEELFDTKQIVSEIVYNGDYNKLVKEIIEYIDGAPLEEVFFRIKLLGLLYVFIRISDLYLLGLQLVKNQMEKEGTNKRGRGEEDEKVFVFGKKKRKKKDKKPTLYFENAEVMGFGEGHTCLPSRIGKIGLKNAVHHIYSTIKISTLMCQMQIFTLVLMCCEGPRFRPIFDHYDKAIDEISESWVWFLIKNWQKMSNLARTRTDVDTYTPPDVLTDDVVKRLQLNPAWADDILTIKHNHRNPPPSKPASKKKIHISIVVIGHADSGKSTTTGHLIYKLGGIKKSVIEKLDKEAEKMRRSSFKYAWVLDRLKAERERGMTIDISLSKFETTRYCCTIIDVPGHRKYINNMINGTSNADSALLVIDSTTGCFEAGISAYGQTREHAMLASILGVKQLICVCNKMDAITPQEYCPSRYLEIVDQVLSLLKAFNYKPQNIQFVPVSGFKGDNLTERSTKLEWYKGPTLLEAIDNLSEPKKAEHKPLRLPVQNVYKIGGLTVPVGRVETGVIKPGMAVTFGPSGWTTVVKSIQMHHEAVDEASPGDYVGFKLTDAVGEAVKRGYVASNSKDDPAKGAASFTAQLIIVNQPHKIQNGFVCLLHCSTSCVSVKFEKILSKIEKSSGKELEKEPKFLEHGDAGMVKMVPTKPIVVERFSEYPPLSRIVLRDLTQTVAVGVIRSVDKIDYKKF